MGRGVCHLNVTVNCHRPHHVSHHSHYDSQCSFEIHPLPHLLPTQAVLSCRFPISLPHSLHLVSVLKGTVFLLVFQKSFPGISTSRAYPSGVLLELLSPYFIICIFRGRQPFISLSVTAIHLACSSFQNIAQCVLGMLSLDSPANSQFRLGTTKGNRAKHLPKSCVRPSVRTAGIGCPSAHATGLESHCQLSQRVRQKEEMAFALSDQVSLCTHLLLCSAIEWRVRKGKPVKISPVGKLGFRCFQHIL